MNALPDPKHPVASQWGPVPVGGWAHGALDILKQTPRLPHNCFSASSFQMLIKTITIRNKACEISRVKITSLLFFWCLVFVIASVPTFPVPHLPVWELWAVTAWGSCGKYDFSFSTQRTFSPRLPPCLCAFTATPEHRALRRPCARSAQTIP